MTYAVRVLGYIPEKQYDEINEARHYDVIVSRAEEIIDWFRNLCELDYGYGDFQPCILDGYKEMGWAE